MPISNDSQPASFQDVVKQYNSLQQQAYQSKSVTQSQIEDLRTTIHDFLEHSAAGSSSQSATMQAIDSDLDSMKQAVNLQSTSGENSDESWDAVRQDMQQLLQSMSPTEAASIYVPTDAGSSQAAGASDSLDDSDTSSVPTEDTDGSLTDDASAPTTIDGLTTPNSLQTQSGTQAVATSQAANTSAIGSSASSTNLPAKTFKMGVLPDYDSNTGGAASFRQKTGAQPSVTSGYADMKNGTFQLSTAKSQIDDAVKAKVSEVSISVSAYDKGPLSQSQLSSLKSMIQYANSKNIKLDIRYGYEMNYGGGGGSQGGRINQNNDPTSFKQQWAQVAQLAHAASPPASMVWSPNIASGGTLPYKDWLPTDPKSIDVYAVDYYPKAGTSTADIAKAVAPVAQMAAQAGKPFVLGEVAVAGGGSAADKARLLKQVTSSEMKAAIPNYSGFFLVRLQKRRPKLFAQPGHKRGREHQRTVEGPGR